LEEGLNFFRNPPRAGIFLSDTMNPEEYEEYLKQVAALSRDVDQDNLIEQLVDDDGYVPGCYWVKPAPTE